MNTELVPTKPTQVSPPMLAKGVPPEKILKDFFLAKVARNPVYSLRAFARDLGISHSHLSRIINRKTRLSIRQAFVLCDKMKLPSEMRNDFLNGMAESWSKTSVEHNLAGSSLSQDDLPFALEMDRFRCISGWHFAAILELTELPSFQSDISWISKCLSVPPLEIKAAIRTLERLGLLKFRNKKWVRTHKNLSIPTQYSEAAVRQFHLQMITKALENLNATAPEDYAGRNISGVTVATDPKRIKAAKKKVDKFRKQMMQFLSKGKPTTLYQLNVQMFPLCSREILK